MKQFARESIKPYLFTLIASVAAPTGNVNAVEPVTVDTRVLPAADASKVLGGSEPVILKKMSQTATRGFARCLQQQLSRLF